MSEAYAIVNIVQGRAVVRDSKEIYLWKFGDLGVRKGDEESSKNFIDPLKTCYGSPGDFPFTEFVTQLDIEYRRYAGRTMFLMGLDVSLSLELRQKGVEVAEQLLASHEEARTQVMKDFLDVPLPEEADLDGCPVTGWTEQLLDAIRKKWRPEPASDVL